MTIELTNLTEAQRIAIEDMLAYWQGTRIGASRWMAFYADGDGNFRPRITVDGHEPRHQDRVDPNRFWTGGKPWSGEYRMDYDAIAWTFHV